MLGGLSPSKLRTAAWLTGRCVGFVVPSEFGIIRVPLSLGMAEFGYVVIGGRVFHCCSGVWGRVIVWGLVVGQLANNHGLLKAGEVYRLGGPKPNAKP